jgi:hypothetical protein
LKIDQHDTVLDQLTDADYLAAAGVIILKEAEGPNVIDEFNFGRKEITNAKEVGDVN